METERLQLTVFDFSAADCAQTAEAVRVFCEQRGLPAEIKQFTAIKPFVMDFKVRCNEGECYDIAFVGVDDIMSVEAARHIRGMDDMFPLFFVSNQGNDYGLEACRLMALHYIIKPVTAEALEIGINRISSRTYSGRRSALLRDEEGEWLDNIHQSPYKREKVE